MRILWVFIIRKLITYRNTEMETYIFNYNELIGSPPNSLSTPCGPLASWSASPPLLQTSPWSLPKRIYSIFVARKVMITQRDEILLTVHIQAIQSGTDTKGRSINIH